MKSVALGLGDEQRVGPGAVGSPVGSPEKALVS